MIKLGKQVIFTKIIIKKAIRSILFKKFWPESSYVIADNQIYIKR
jgi:hypothetical protein